MQINKYIIVFLLFKSWIVCCQDDKVNWLMFHQAQKLHDDFRLFGGELKETFIFFYDAKNSWCERMRYEVYCTPDLANYLNINYIPVLWDINEYKREITFATNHTYNYKTHRHHFVEFITDNRYSFPYAIILNKKNKIRIRIPGFVNENNLLSQIKR